MRSTRATSYGATDAMSATDAIGARGRIHAIDAIRDREPMNDPLATPATPAAAESA